MKLTEEKAVRLHRMMWSDMQRELGDNPSGEERLKFKREWIKRNFPGESIANDCWLCEYASSVANCGGGDPYCKHCPISWPDWHCNTLDFSYAKEPISEILALPARYKELVTRYVANEGKAGRDYPYARIKKVLSEASGVPDYVCAEDHIKAIQEKAVQQSNLSKIYGDTKMELAKASGLKAAVTTTDHIKEIKEKAVEEYFATMDVDEAFKQYAKEQKEPIFHTLAEASGLSAGNESVEAHISKIRSKEKYSGRKEAIEEIFKSLSTHSGISPDIWAVGAHVDAIREKASNEKDLNEIEIRKKLKDAIGALKLYQSTLSYESNLPSSAPIADHIKQIREYAFSDGQDSERERIMDKIGEMLNK